MNNQWQKQERYYQSNCIEFLFEVGIRECVVVLHCYAFITLNTRSQNITCSIVFLVWMISFSQVNVHSLNDEVLDVWNGCGDVWHFLFFLFNRISIGSNKWLLPAEAIFGHQKYLFVNSGFEPCAFDFP